MKKLCIMRMFSTYWTYILYFLEVVYGSVVRYNNNYDSNMVTSLKNAKQYIYNKYNKYIKIKLSFKGVTFDGLDFEICQ